MVAARPGLSHSLQVDGEEELIFRVRSWFSSGQASLSPGTRTRGESDAGYSSNVPSQPCLCSLSVQLGLLGKPLLPLFCSVRLLQIFPQKLYLHSPSFKKPVRLQKDLKSLSLAQITPLLDSNVRLSGGAGLWASGLCLKPRSHH